MLLRGMRHPHRVPLDSPESLALPITPRVATLHHHAPSMSQAICSIRPTQPPFPYQGVDIIVFPPFDPPHTIELYTDAWNQFHVSLSHPSPVYEYWVEIHAEGMGSLRQKLFVPRECYPDPGIALDILLHPAVKPSEGYEEDTVAIESLARKIPDKITQAFEKSTEKPAKTAPQDVSAPLVEILKTTPDYYDATLALGLEYKRAGRSEDSIRTLTHALEINSGSMLARSALGQYSYEANDFRKAVELLSEAVRLGSTSSSVYYMLGASYVQLGQLDLAEASLLRSLKFTPSVPKAHMQLYNVHMARHQPELALKEADTYLEEYPEAKDKAYVQSMTDKIRKTLKPQP